MTEAVAVALIAAIGSIVTASISAYVLVRVGRVERTTAQTHGLVNGLTRELRAAEVGQAHADGVAAGEQSQRDRAAEAQP